ncbi:polymorphic toxin-type HINT domain-containing protein [Oceanirhabdus sp. W0125-5]|uniref:polymorphic toxin-type HINT domain-containing protein n=1 Tax=Oceanirhabdus sp. W0125-5 TaxID=2999116 RepID=UPI0022F336A3|nr:polymorphic toxin-type HINT domain-containing protein [Oceanirhabdus sp. W0125-5]WBW95944.1 polymorphic toxin-type HINT domain-containing protein [Oceanirhabdus sp. W0125-5]
MDIVGFIPALGDILDGVNASISFLRGNLLDGILSLVSIVPAVGSALAVPVKTLIKNIDKTDEIAKFARIVGETKFITKLREIKTGTITAINNLTTTIANKIKSSAINLLGRLGKKIDEAISVMDRAIKEKLGLVEQQLDEVVTKAERWCFVKGTLVLTSNGLRPIEEIQIGDKVYSQNVETGEKGLKEVKVLFRNQASILVNLIIDGEKIVTTESHLFWTKNKGWIKAGELTKGEELVKYDGVIGYVEEINIEELKEATTVYNFEVEDWHTYYVSNKEILVHNDCFENVANAVTDSLVNESGEIVLDRVDELIAAAKKGEFDESELNVLITKIKGKNNPDLDGVVKQLDEVAKGTSNLTQIATKYSDEAMNYTYKEGKYIPIEETYDNYKQLDDIAKNMYSTFRNSSDDIAAIAENTGWDFNDIEKIKNHIFIDELKLDDGIRRLDPDYEMSQAWDRLLKGEYYENDILLLKHELYESTYYKLHGVTQRVAHDAANEIFNWQAFIQSL